MSRLREEDATRRRRSGFGPDHSEALARGLQIITAFDGAHRSMTLSEIAAAIGLPRATARRAILTLVALGYASLEGRQFRLTPRVLGLASAYLTANAASTLLQPACDRIAAAVGESCSAAVFEAGEAVMIAHALPRRLMRAGAGIGYRLPAYCSALGRVLLSALRDHELNAYLDTARLIAITPRTVTARDRLAGEIAAVRRDGYSFVAEEVELGFCSVAVPLRRFDGTVVAAINVGAHVGQAGKHTMLGAYLDALRAAADELSGQLV